MKNASLNPSRDPLGYDIYAQTLWTRVQAALNKDADGRALGDDPLVIGLFGEWGAGKSYLLKLIQYQAIAQLLVQQKDRSFKAETDKTSDFELTIPVFFQPWKYEHEPHLHVPMLMHILDAYIEAFKKSQTASETGDTAVKALGEKAKPILGWLWRGCLRPAAQAFAGQFSIKLSAGAEIEELANAQHTLTNIQIQKELGAQQHLTATQDGLFFYKWHETLKQLTRPTDYPELLKDGEKSLAVSGRIRINFVIFIDDLDRCLPEKAVQSLELIKTIFNVESFAFVLALDDEVIERGIGHRYKEYELKDKKPKMPITGFEYLEKIVHLPFRLPALTPNDALTLLQAFEADCIASHQALHPAVAANANLNAYTPQAWFQPREIAFRADTDARQLPKTIGSDSVTGDASLTISDVKLNLAAIVLACFDAYVPRKLIRVVELFHQTAHIAHQRGRPLDAHLGGDCDPRLVLAFALLQLFQPDLFRTLKRTRTGFDVLRDGFAAADPLHRLNPSLSDADLMHWAAYFKHPTVPLDLLALNTQFAALDKDSERSPAQKVRLPILERLLEHRAVQRHVFDPLKLFQALQDSQSTHPAFAFNPAPTYAYYSLLSAHPLDAATPANVQSVSYTVSQISKPSTAQDTRRTVTLPNVRGIYEKLVSAEPREQETLKTELNMAADQAIAPSSLRELLTLVIAWLGADRKSNHANSRSLLRGLQYLAPFVPKACAEAGEFWKLVQDAVTLPTAPNLLTEDPSLASLYCDVRSMLGQDTRFDAERFYLLKDRYAANTAAEEPIAGFVRMAGGAFKAGHDKQGDNKPKPLIAGAPYYIARSHVTVAQYAAFLDAKPHETEGLWDAQGWAWVNDTLKVPKRKEKEWQTHLDGRTGEARRAPHDWAAQQRIGSRAVHSITWFEARAYARWLTAQLAGEFKNITALNNYQVRLPTELQWEYAATGGQGRAQRWPWGDDEASAHQRANISASKIGHASIAGCFAPNEQGLWDMAGNLWQWQDGLYRHVQTDSEVQSLDGSFKQLAKGAELTFGKSWDDSDTLALRGGSWISSADGAAAAYRGWIRALGWHDICGFRVVLSLAEHES